MVVCEGRGFGDRVGLEVREGAGWWQLGWGRCGVGVGLEERA